MIRGIKVLVFFLLVCTNLVAQTTESRDSIPYGNLTDENLLIAVYNHDIAKVRQFINKGANVNKTDDNGLTPLLYAISNKDMAIVRILLSNGADPNKTTENAFTPRPLILSIKLGYTDITKLLLENKANVSVKDNFGASPLHYASFYNDTTLIDLLIKGSANPDDTTFNGETPLLLACYNGSLKAANMLIEAGTQINKADNKGYTPLMMAAQNGHYGIALRLLQNWADIRHQNKMGFSALSLAIANGFADIADLLRLNGADVNEKNTLSLNPRGIAVAFHQKEIKDSLKHAGAKNNYLPFFVGFCPELQLFTNSKETLTGLSISRLDLKYQLELGIHYYFRVEATPVLFKTDDNSFVQYWERRHRIGLSLKRTFNFYQQNQTRIGLLIGTSYDLHFGKYRGTTIPIKQGFYLSPIIGLAYQKNDFVGRLTWNYTNYRITGLNDWHIGISIMYRLWTKPSNLNNELKWME